ncbi:MAG: DUF998 domain-containing protein [Phormidesmis sp.]
MRKKYFGLSTAWILIVLGVVGLFGCLSVVVTDIVGALAVKGYNPITQTISSLAITDRAWIQDVGLNLFSASFAACGAGFLILDLGKLRWKIGSILLLLLAVDILVISEYDTYADADSFGSTVHLACTVILGGLFILAPWLTAFGLKHIGRRYYLYSLATAGFWGAFSFVFFLIPTNWDGAYERFLSLIVIAWVMLASWLLVDQGRQMLRSTPSVNNAPGIVKKLEYRGHKAPDS